MSQSFIPNNPPFPDEEVIPIVPLCISLGTTWGSKVRMIEVKGEYVFGIEYDTVISGNPPEKLADSTRLPFVTLQDDGDGDEVTTFFEQFDHALHWKKITHTNCPNDGINLGMIEIIEGIDTNPDHCVACINLTQGSPVLIIFNSKTGNAEIPSPYVSSVLYPKEPITRFSVAQYNFSLSEGDNILLLTKDLFDLLASSQSGQRADTQLRVIADFLQHYDIPVDLQRRISGIVGKALSPIYLQGQPSDKYYGYWFLRYNGKKQPPTQSVGLTSTSPGIADTGYAKPVNLQKPSETSGSDLMTLAQSVCHSYVQMFIDNQENASALRLALFTGTIPDDLAVFAVIINEIREMSQRIRKEIDSSGSLLGSVSDYNDLLTLITILGVDTYDNSRNLAYNALNWARAIYGPSHKITRRDRIHLKKLLKELKTSDTHIAKLVKNYIDNTSTHYNH